MLFPFQFGRCRVPLNGVYSGKRLLAPLDVAFIAFRRIFSNSRADILHRSRTGTGDGTQGTDQTAPGSLPASRPQEINYPLPLVDEIVGKAEAPQVAW